MNQNQRPLSEQYRKAETAPGIFAWFHLTDMNEATIVVCEGPERVELVASMPTHLLRDKDALKKAKALYPGREVVYHRDFAATQRQASTYNSSMPTERQSPYPSTPFTQKHHGK